MSGQNLRGMRLRDSQIDEMYDRGAILVPEFFNRTEIETSIRDIRQLFSMALERTSRLTSLVDAATAPREFSASNWFDNVEFPFASSEALNLLGCHPEILAVARRILQSDRIRMHYNYASAKFTGAMNYSQPLHLDSPTHTLLMPSRSPRFSSINVVIYLSDVNSDHGPLSYLPFEDTRSIPSWKKTLTSEENDALAPREILAVGPAGSVLFYFHHLYHRGTNLLAPGGARYQLLSAFHAADASSFVGGLPWPRRFHPQGWSAFLPHANDEQLELIGIPPGGHPYWTHEILDNLAEQHPNWDLTTYRKGIEG